MSKANISKPKDRKRNNLGSKVDFCLKLIKNPKDFKGGIDRGEYKDIPINDLVVNAENPRFVAAENELQAIYAMLEDQGLANRNKIVALAKDIAKHGLSPLETILTSPLDGQTCVNFALSECRLHLQAVAARGS